MKRFNAPGMQVHDPIQACCVFYEPSSGSKTSDLHRTLRVVSNPCIVLVAFQRFAQFPDDEREKATNSCDRRAYSYDND